MTPTDLPLPLAARADAFRPSAIREILKLTARPGIVSFAGGLPAPELFPVEAVARACEQVLSSGGASALQYDVTEGHAPLREWIAADLAAHDGPIAPVENILVTNGGQQALDLLAKLMLDPGDVVFTENPSYLGALQVFRGYQARVVGLASDGQGLLPDALEQALSTASVRPKFLYLIPNFQNPTGATLPLARRLRVAEIAARHGLIVVEDDPYGRLRFEGASLPAISALPAGQPWVHLGTTSKILAPGLRIGWIATSDARLHEKIVSAKQAADLHTASFNQRVVNVLVRTPGLLENHVSDLCATYRRRRDLMLSALEQDLPPGCTWTRPEGGLFLWVRLPDGSNALELLPRAMEARVAYVPGAPFWTGLADPATLRLNFSNATDTAIREGVARLGQVIATRVPALA